MQPNEQQRANLKRLADGLRTVKPEKFHMGSYNNRWRDAHEIHEVIHDCATTACALGYGPAFLPETVQQDDPHESWLGYSRRVFGVARREPKIIGRSPEWSYLFDDSWSDVDNTPTGAADRIDHYLTHGVPDEYC